MVSQKTLDERGTQFSQHTEHIAVGDIKTHSSSAQGSPGSDVCPGAGIAGRWQGNGPAPPGMWRSRKLLPPGQPVSLTIYDSFIQVYGQAPVHRDQGRLQNFHLPFQGYQNLEIRGEVLRL
jgi:hypothetical protein